MLKKAEVKTSSLEEMLEQKVKENQELASICDELISKVGGSEWAKLGMTYCLLPMQHINLPSFPSAPHIFFVSVS